MNPFRDRILAAAGLLALVLYVLACRPSFSPDGRHVLLSLPASDTNHIVWAFDRQTQTWTNLLSTSAEIAAPGWTSDGRSIVALHSASNGLRVTVAPFGAPGKPRHYLLPADRDNSNHALLYGPAIAGPYLYHGSGTELYRLDLRDGTSTNLDAGGKVQVHLHPTGPLVWIERGGKTEFRRISDAPLKLEPLARLPANLSALAGHSAVLDKVFANTNVLRRSELVCGHREQTLFASALRRAGSNDFDVCVGEIQLDTGGTRWTTLLRVANLKSGEALCLLALAPDGRTLAFAPTTLEGEIRPEDWALYFVDVAAPEFKVTKFPLPVPRKP